MALGGRQIVSLDDRGRPDRSPASRTVDFEAPFVIQKAKRRRPKLTPEQVRRNTYLVWYSYHESGLSVRDIEGRTGFSKSQVAAGIRWAREHGEAYLRGELSHAG